MTVPEMELKLRYTVYSRIEADTNSAPPSPRTESKARIIQPQSLPAEPFLEKAARLLKINI